MGRRRAHEGAPAAGDEVTVPAARRFGRWLRQGHVLLGIALIVKLLWFDAQADVGLPPVLLWAATLGTSVLLVCWLPLVRPRPRLVALVALDVLVSTIILVDLLHFRFFSSLVTVALLPQAGQTDDVLASILTLFSWWDLWLYLDVVALVLLALAGRAGPLLEPVDGFRSKRSRELVVFAVVIGTTVLGFPVSALVRSGPFNVSWDMMAYQTTGLVGFHAYDAIRFAEDRWGDREPSPAELARVDERLSEPVRGRRLDGTPRHGAFEGARVLVVQVEGLESTVVGRSFEGHRITPHLDELVTRSVSFPDTFHQVGAGHTADAEWLTGCSLYPAAQGTAYLTYASNELRCLPEILRERGYATAAHHANDRAFWNRSTIYPAIGYDRFYASDDITGERLGSWGVGDREFLEQTVERFAAQQVPSYELAITLTSHHPYRAQLPDDTERVSGSLGGTILGDYLDSVAYVDAALGTMVDVLEAAGVWDDTVVVVYGDHDSGIPDPDLWAEFLGAEPSDYELAVQRQAIPLIVHLPDDASAGLEVQQPVGQVDVAPMLGHLLGLEPDEERSFLGTDPFEQRSRPVGFRNGGFATADLFLPSPAGPCFDRASGVELPLARCSDARSEVGAELAVSDAITEFDLFARDRP